MKASETVMGNKKLQLLGQQYEDDLPTCDLNHYLLEAQAEITWKLAIKEVVDWLDVYEDDTYCRISNHTQYSDWQAQLKKWGVK